LGSDEKSSRLLCSEALASAGVRSDVLAGSNFDLMSLPVFESVGKDLGEIKGLERTA